MKSIRKQRARELHSAKGSLRLTSEQLEPRLCLAATAEFLGDANTRAAHANIHQIAAADDFFYFVAHDAQHGSELWRTDGSTAGTVLVKDIKAGPDSSYLSIGQSYGRGTGSAVLDGNVLIFAADDGVHGQQLWRSDGTSEGTFALSDIALGRSANYFGRRYVRTSAPSWLEEHQNEVFFAVNESGSGNELWKTDGTKEGTVLVTDIAPGSASSNPTQIVSFGDKLVFAANDGVHGNELWTSDGTAAGTHLLHDNNPSGDGVIYFCGHQSCNFPLTVHPTLNRGFFTGTDGNTTTLWATDGTTEGTFSLGGGPSYSPTVFPLANTVVFTYWDGDSNAIYSSNGTRDSLTLVRDLDLDTYVHSFLVAGDQLYFSLEGNSRPGELWQSDGTAEGTFAAIGDLTNANYPQAKGVIGDTLFFSANDRQRDLLWKSDERGASVIAGPSGYLSWVVSTGDKLIYASSNGVWSVDGASNEANRLYTGEPGYSKLLHDGELLFTSQDGQIWKTDGTSEGTTQVSEITLPTQDGNPSAFVRFRGKHYYLANQGSGMGLFEHDPALGTSRRVQSIPYANPDSLRVFGDRLVFLRNEQLWSTDGSSAERISSVNNVFEFEVMDNAIFMLSYGSSTGSLHRTDGTEDGTELLTRVMNARNLTSDDGTLYFYASDSQYREQIWTSDGTKEGTKAISAARNNSSPTALAPTDNGVFFSYRVWDNEGRVGEQTWHSDGSLKGTIQLTDFKAASSNYYYSPNSSLRTLGNLAVFVADDGEHGAELWTSNGTKEGTRLIADLDGRESAAGSAPRDFVRAGNASYFVAGGLDGFQSVWRVPDESPDQAQAVVEGLRAVANLTPFGDRLLFSGSRGFDEPTLWITDESNTKANALRGGTPQEIHVIESRAYFVANANGRRELWTTDGTRLGTSALTSNNANGARPANLAAVGDTLFFTASSRTDGRELWKSSGTKESTTLVRDMNPGLEGTTFSEFTAMGAKLLFVADNNTSGRELWISDGTEAGTYMVADLRNEVTKDSLADQFVQVGQWTYFLADDGINGRELWRTNGTAEGTSLVEDREPGVGDASVDSLTVAGDRLYFTAHTSDRGQTRLFVVTSPDADATEVQPSATGRNRLFAPRDLTVFNNKLYFTASVTSDERRRLYGIDSTAEGSVAQPISDAGDPAELMAVGDQLFFAADDDELGRELFRTDGTPEGTSLVIDIFDALAVASEPSQFVGVGDRVYFTAHDRSHGTELWSTDGTVAGTRMVTDLRQGSVGSSPAELTAFDGQLIFSADGLNEKVGRELWITDGTAEGTRTVRRSTGGSFPQDPRSFVVTDDGVFFFALWTGWSTELWTTNGTHNGTRRVSSLSRDFIGAIPNDEQLVAAGGNVYFAATDGERGRELWTSNGTSAGTKMVRDIRPGSASSISTDERTHKLVPHEDKVFFAADSDGNQAAEIWVTDGTEDGTQFVHDPRSNTVGAFPLDVGDGWLYFSSVGPAGQGNELWKTDGSVENTAFVADLSSGRSSTIFFPHGELTQLRPGLFLFPAVTQREGTELWVTDGTESGTRPLDLEPGTGSTRFGDLVQIQVVDEVAYFIASVPSKGTGLWKSDGTVAGSELVHRAGLTPWPDLRLVDGRLYFGVSDVAGSLAIYHEDAVQNVDVSSPIPKGSSSPSHFEAIDDQLYFVADDSAHGREVWRSDGTTEGTRRVSDLLPGPSSADPLEFTSVGEQIFFSASTSETGRELWTIPADGEPKLVRDIMAEELGSNPAELTAWNEQLVFTINEPNRSPILWISDGTGDGTRPLLGPSDSGLLRAPRIAGVDEDRLFVFAESADADLWLWRFDSPGVPPTRVARADAHSSFDVIDGQLHFVGADSETGSEPWISDGTAEGSRRLADINQTTFGSDPGSINVLGEAAYFVANDGGGRDLWQTDGSAAGTRLVRSVVPDLPVGSAVELLVGPDGFFLTQTADAGTTLVSVQPVSETAEILWNDSSLRQFDNLLAVSGDRAFFTVTGEGANPELWVSDGTSLGTHVAFESEGSGGRLAIEGRTPLNDGYLFVVQDPEHGTELWFTTGEVTTTHRIANIQSGAAGSAIGPIHVAGNHILFSANDGTHGSEPWISDGTPEGTRMLINIDDRTRGSDPSWLTATDSQIFFVASDEDGKHLWRWTPTMDAPERVDSEVQRPSELAAAGSLLYFSGYHPDTGHELWISDGSGPGTRLLSDVSPGHESSAPKSVSVTERGDLLFSAVDAAHGREAWWLPALAGDTNADQDVDFEDFLTFALHFGGPGTWSEGDFDEDGVVGFEDFLSLTANFGRPA